MNRKRAKVSTNPAQRVAGFDPARRALLARLGRFAIYTAPIMTTLLIAPEVAAHHKPGHAVGPVQGPDCNQVPNNPQCTGGPVHTPPPCAGPEPRPPFCAAGSIGASPESSQFSGEDFSYTADPGWPDE